ncbi:MAG: putative zinc-binding protein [Planctomycetes bacterium]|nr:putative zinc-binding protein [Planctomycetota bacterium]
MNGKNDYKGKDGPKLIFACSGAADVGEIADRAARKMAKDGIGKMFCLAGIGGRVDVIMNTARTASDILAIDGCPLNCTKNCLEHAGFDEFKHMQLADMDLDKGNSPASEENIAMVARRGAELIGEN